MRSAIAILTALISVAPLARADGLQELNDYPTLARADYVFACMSVNGGTRDALARCACSIDIIAGILPYEDYVNAETVRSLLQLRGERTAMFRSAEFAKSAVAELRRAQAEAEITCF